MMISSLHADYHNLKELQHNSIKDIYFFNYYQVIKCPKTMSVESKTIFLEMQDINNSEIQKSLQCLGLNISESELAQLKSGKTVSLMARKLSEVGSAFILAEALAERNGKQKINVADLPESVLSCLHCFEVPIYRLSSDLLGHCCLHLYWIASLQLVPEELAK